MFVSNAREAEPFVAPDLSEIRVLVDRATVGVASVSLAHATVAAGAETVWPAGVPQKIRALGSVPLTFLCACGPAYLPERDQRMGEAAVIGAWP